MKQLILYFFMLEIFHPAENHGQIEKIFEVLNIVKEELQAYASGGTEYKQNTLFIFRQRVIPPFIFVCMWQRVYLTAIQFSLL